MNIVVITIIQSSTECSNWHKCFTHVQTLISSLFCMEHSVYIFIWNCFVFKNIWRCDKSNFFSSLFCEVPHSMCFTIITKFIFIQEITLRLKFEYNNKSIIKYLAIIKQKSRRISELNVVYQWVVHRLCTIIMNNSWPLNLMYTNWIN